jgi:hypothetical protein
MYSGNQYRPMTFHFDAQKAASVVYLWKLLNLLSIRSASILPQTPGVPEFIIQSRASSIG